MNLTKTHQDAITVPCPVCPAAAGTICGTTAGRPFTHTLRSREARIAARDIELAACVRCGAPGRSRHPLGMDHLAVTLCDGCAR